MLLILSEAQDSFDRHIKLGGGDTLAGGEERIGDHIGVGRVQLPEHLPDLIVAQTGVGVVHHNDELDLGVGHVAKHLLMF